MTKGENSHRIDGRLPVGEKLLVGVGSDEAVGLGIVIRGLTIEGAYR